MNENLSHALEGLDFLDPEYHYIASELARLCVDECEAKGRKPRVDELTSAYCPSVANAVADRMNVQRSSAKLSAAEASLVGSNALVAFDPNQKLGFDKRVSLAARFVVAAAKLRAIVSVSHEGLNPTYWPFGMDGGFCNPNKLAQLD